MQTPGTTATLRYSALTITKRLQGASEPKSYALSGLFNELEAVAVRVAAENRGAPGAASGKGDLRLAQPIGERGDIIDVQSDVAITTNMRRATVARVGIGQFQQMNLLCADIEPRAGITEIGALCITYQTEYIAIEAQRDLGVVHDDAGVGNGATVKHPRSITCIK